MPLTSGSSMPMARWSRRNGSPLPFGAHYVQEDDAYNFALYSKHATSVDLVFFAQPDARSPSYSYRLEPTRNKTARVWHCRIPRSVVEEAPFYGYHVDGPDAAGHRFDVEKVLLDPYARSVAFPEGFEREASVVRGRNYGRAPLGVVTEPTSLSVAAVERPPRHDYDLVIYELHVKGFTAHQSSGVAPPVRGTFAGLVEKIPYLIDLGVTAVELMPVFQTDPSEGNYWGYSPLAFFALNHSYASNTAFGGELAEFRAMVAAFHEAGIEVLLDIVLNHTAEGNEYGPVYSLKGIDNTTYYLLDDDFVGYRNDAGVGNVLHTANRAVRQLVLDTLRYWATAFDIDGFRFDLASIFTRDCDGSVNLDDPPIIGEISSDPALATRRLIAEAWDLGSYQLGRNFPGMTWLQWNGKYRDDVRRFVRGDPGFVGVLMTRLYGSDDIFPDTAMDSYRPYQSVNLLTCHDGMTLYDLVAYNHKHNQANGEHETDGASDDYSFNYGVEGDEGCDQSTLSLRERQAKNFFCLLLLSNGTPMFRAGDEFLQTQGGNNNPYNQDNETTWLDWSRLERHAEVRRFVKYMIAFRKAHPTISRAQFWRDDVTWYGVGATPDLSFDSHSLAYHLRGASEGDTDLYVMINAYWEPLRFEVQVPGEWQLAVDTAKPAPDNINTRARLTQGSADCWVAARSIQVLQRGSK